MFHLEFHVIALSLYVQCYDLAFTAVLIPPKKIIHTFRGLRWTELQVKSNSGLIFDRVEKWRVKWQTAELDSDMSLPLKWPGKCNRTSESCATSEVNWRSCQFPEPRASTLAKQWNHKNAFVLLNMNVCMHYFSFKLKLVAAQGKIVL